jgi:DNA repair protein RecN (Recombination protein N)
MLQELSIKNFAIIEDINISFSDGFTILTGETGAGKSIIINAVNLLLGSRASTKLIRSGAESAELEALFQVLPHSRIAALMKEHGYDASEGLLVRRIISRSNRHKIFINGRMATMQMLNMMTANLASISSQHEHQNLLKDELHLLILDQFGGLLKLRETVSTVYQKILPLIDQLHSLRDAQSRQAEQRELLEFQKKEISTAEISPNEDSVLEQEKMRLKNAESLYETAHNAIEDLYSAPGSIIERLGEIKKNLETGEKIDAALKPLLESVSETAYQLEDLTDHFRTYLKKIQMDDKRLDFIETRLDELNKLKRKYGGSLDQTIAYLNRIDHELSQIDQLSDQIRETEKQLDERYRELTESALELSGKRSKTARRLAASIEKELDTLKMPQTQFQVSMRQLSADNHHESYLTVNGKGISETGIDRAQFMISPNVGEALKPLAKIASGGELSRVILAIKAILATTDSVETVVFDEVDAGIGGGVAEVVGQKLADLSKHHQIICITHLPQIAKFGHHHFIIHKQVIDGRTITGIKPIGKKDRVKEIARMLGGVEITNATINHAREMLKNDP